MVTSESACESEKRFSGGVNESNSFQWAIGGFSSELGEEVIKDWTHDVVSHFVFGCIAAKQAGEADSPHPEGPLLIQITICFSDF